MSKMKISTLELSVMANIKNIGVGHIIPQNLLTSNTVKSNQVSAVINNMVAKGLVIRQKDLFGTNVSLTRSGKIQTTKAIKKQAIAA